MTEFDPHIHGPELSAYLDGELDAAGRAAVERLLAESAAARRELEQLRIVANGLRSLSRLSAPAAVLAEISRNDHRHIVLSEAPLDTRVSKRIWRMRAYINTLATAAALGLVWIAGRSLTSTAPVTADLARVPAEPPGTRKLKSLEDLESDRVTFSSAGGRPTAVPATPNDTDAPTIASLSKPTGMPGAIKSEIAAESAIRGEAPFEQPVIAGRMAGSSGATLIPSSELTPVCNVVVNTRSAEEYEAIQSWAEDVSRSQAASDFSRVSASRDQTPSSAELVQLRVPSTQLEPVLTSLGQRVAPGVRIEIAFQPPAMYESESNLAYRKLEAATPEDRDTAGDEAKRRGGGDVTTGNYGLSSREKDSSAIAAGRLKEGAADSNKSKAAADVAAPPAAGVAATGYAGGRNPEPQDSRPTVRESSPTAARSRAAYDKNVVLKPDRAENAEKSTLSPASQSEFRKEEQNYKLDGNLGAQAPATTQAELGAARSDDAGTLEYRSQNRAAQNQLVIQAELNNAMQLQTQTNVPIPLRFALPQLRNQLGAGTVTVNLIVNRPPADSQPASSPSP